MKRTSLIPDQTIPTSVPVAIYARVSTTKQVGGRFDSCEAQVEGCQKYISDRADEGWVLTNTFVDPAYSGKDMERPSMRKLMKAIAAGEIRAVVVYRLERVSRSMDAWAPFRKFLDQHDCVLHSITEDIENRTPAGRFKTNLLMGVNEYERENVAEKTAKKMLKQAEHGFWNGGNEPYGYINDPKAKKLHLNEDEAKVVRDIYRLSAELTPLSEIARILTERGVLTRRRTIKRRQGQDEPTLQEIGGNRFRDDVLRRMIANPLYRGVVRFNGQEYAGQHQAIVSAETWEAANAAIAQAKPTAKVPACDLGRDKHFNLLKGILFCGCCEGAFTPHASGKLDAHGRPYRYYTCSRVEHNRTVARCLVRQISAVAIEDAVVALLGQMARHPKMVESVLNFKKTNAGEIQKELEPRIRKLDRDIEKSTTSLNNLLEALAESGVSALRAEIWSKFEDLKGRKERALVERTRLKQELDALKHDALAPAQVCASLEKFEKLWPDFTQEEKREFVSLIVSRVAVHSAEGKTDDGRKNARLVELKVKLHLPELLGGGVDAESAARRLGGRRPSFTLNATVQLAAGTGDTVILSPFHHRVTQPRKKKRITDKPGAEHPFERAVRWSALLEKDGGCSARDLARREKTSEATVSMTLALMRLTPAIRQTMHLLVATGRAYHFGLRVLALIAAMSPQKQGAAFAALLHRWNIQLENHPSEQL